MEMENSRRSAMDRSREPGLKKARLADETPNRERPFPHGRPSDPRLRAAEREERGDPSRGGLTSSHQQQELVAQYKTALGELTFNSKPIITNLTIIAGENHHAAKAIASTVCANILEVPSEQKLPSLYLLDSIVKNIGRDYIKYFGARLPEVFCKAFKQVDSSIHPGMRHLFGTWKGVFPPGPLQIIEKELGFTSTVNGSSGATTSRSDAQTQHQPHSIHVNPKYLEARQRLQQPPRAKETSRDDITSSIAPVANADRMTTAGSSRQWEDLTIKGIQRSQREQLSEPLLANRAYRGYEFSSNFSPQVLGSERVSETVKERAGQDKAWYGPSSTAADASTNRRSGIDIVRGYGKYRESGTAEMAPQLPPVHMNVTSKNSKPASKSWKNSEEEEFMWENINFRSEGHEGTSGSIKSAWFADDGDKTAGMRRGKQTPMETQHLDSRLSQFEALTQYVNRSSVEDRVLPSSKAEDQFLPARRQPDIEARVSMDTALDSLSTHRTSLGHHTSSIWPPREAPSRSINLNQLSSRILSQSEGQSVSLNGQKPLELSGHLNQARAATSPEPFQSHAISGQQQSHAKSQYLQNISESSAPSGRPRHPVQKLEPLHSDPLAQPSQSSNQMQKQPALALSLGTHQAEGLCAKSHSNNAPVEVSRQSSTSNLLAAIMKSGLLSEISASNLQNLNVQPPLPSGPPPIHAMTSAGPSVAPSSASLSTSDNNAPALAPLPVRGVLPPLPPGPPPPSSLSNTCLKSSSAAASTLNPLSSLLSSLVAKGLISSPASEQTTITSQTPNKLQNSSNSDDSTSLLTPSTRVSSEVPAPLVEEHSVHESSPPDVALSECATELNSLLGLDFKPEIIREHYPYVINSLFNDLKEQCHKCGLRFRLEEQLHSHLDWHDSQDPHKSHSEKESRKWYATVGSWITGTMELSSAPGSLEEKDLVEEDCESMVPADECQCICALCGEPFKDFYSEKRDEWMYKGTVYLKLSDTQVDKACINESTGQAPIVHAECISRNEVHDVVTVYQNEAELS